MVPRCGGEPSAAPRPVGPLGPTQSIAHYPPSTPPPALHLVDESGWQRTKLVFCPGQSFVCLETLSRLHDLIDDHWRHWREWRPRDEGPPKYAEPRLWG